MSGKRQHSLPRFLLRGFAWRESSGGDVSAHLFTKAGPLETNVKNIAVEGFFYSEGPDSSVDDEMTKLGI